MVYRREMVSISSGRARGKEKRYLIKESARECSAVGASYDGRAVAFELRCCRRIIGHFHPMNCVTAAEIAADLSILAHGFHSGVGFVSGYLVGHQSQEKR
jgi:hypothetical protein